VFKTIVIHQGSVGGNDVYAYTFVAPPPATAFPVWDGLEVIGGKKGKDPSPKNLSLAFEVGRLQSEGRMGGRGGEGGQHLQHPSHSYWSS